MENPFFEKQDQTILMPGDRPIDTSQVFSMDTAATHPQSGFLKGLEEKEGKFLELLAERQKQFEQKTAETLKKIYELQNEEVTKVLVEFKKRIDAVFLLQQNLENVLDAFVQLAWLDGDISPTKKAILTETVVQFIGRNLPKNDNQEANVH